MFWTAIALALTFLTPYKSFFTWFILVLAESHPFAMNDNLISFLIFHDKPTCGNLIGVNRQMADNQQPSEIQPYPDSHPKSYLIVKSSTKLSVPVNVSINRAMSSFPCNAKRIVAIIFRSSWCHNINNMEKFNQSTVLSAIYDGQRKILLLRLNQCQLCGEESHLWELVCDSLSKNSTDRCEM